MPDREKVIKHIADCIDAVDGLTSVQWVLVKLDELKGALNLLEAQEPVDPEVDVDEWRCGKCGHPLEHQEMLGSNVLFHEQYAYCPNCGRKVKWDA